MHRPKILKIDMCWYVLGVLINIVHLEFIKLRNPVNLHRHEY